MSHEDFKMVFAPTVLVCFLFCPSRRFVYKYKKNRYFVYIKKPEVVLL